MSSSTVRSRRVADLLQREIASLLQRGNIATSLATVVITSVDLSNDLRNAKIYFTTLLDKDREPVLETIKQASKLIRQQVAKRIKLRYMPELYFFYDETTAYASRLTQLIDEVNLNLNADDEFEK